jgi:hypothetical protein
MSQRQRETTKIMERAVLVQQRRWVTILNISRQFV